MSAPVLPDDVKFVQQMLCSAGCYTGPRNGVWNSDVDRADQRFEELSTTLATTLGVFDPRSEKCIRTLHPKAQEAARRFLTAAKAAGFDARIISGTRTYAEQAALYKIGRPPDTTNKRVTNADAGESNHNFGIAWDIGLFDHGAYVTAEEPYRKASAFCPPGVEWGGSWKTFPDPPHYQLAVGRPLKEIRAAFESGQSFLTA
jgi:peptidoglycan LD-endopeptidase CwlK